MQETTPIESEEQTLWGTEDFPAISPWPESGGGLTRPLKPAWVGQAYEIAVGAHLWVKPEEQPFANLPVDGDNWCVPFALATLDDDRLPQRRRLEEDCLFNHFDYELGSPTRGTPFHVTTEVVDCPWCDGAEKLVFVGLETADIDPGRFRERHAVVLGDFERSGAGAARLWLLRSAARRLARSMGPRDTLRLVRGGGAVASLADAETPERFLIEAVHAVSSEWNGGSRVTVADVEQGYSDLLQKAGDGSIRRVVLLVGGPLRFDEDELEKVREVVRRGRQGGVGLSIVKIGERDPSDHLIAELAREGGGTLTVANHLADARSALLGATGVDLPIVAHDVRLQIVPNARTVAQWRTLGHHTHTYKIQYGFADASWRSWNLTAEHSMVALLLLQIGDRAGGPAGASSHAAGRRLATVRVRYRKSATGRPRVVNVPVFLPTTHASMSPAFSFAAAIAAVGMKLRRDYLAPDITADQLRGMVARGNEVLSAGSTDVATHLIDRAEAFGLVRR